MSSDVPTGGLARCSPLIVNVPRETGPILMRDLAARRRPCNRGKSRSWVGNLGATVT